METHTYSVRMRENADQNNSEYRHFLLSAWLSLSLSLSLSLRSRLNIFSWLIHICKIKCIKTFKIMIHYNKCHSIFNIYSTHAKERIRNSTASSSFIRNLFTDLFFSTHELTGDHKFRESRYIIYTYKLNTYKLNNWFNLRLVLMDKQIYHINWIKLQW